MAAQGSSKKKKSNFWERKWDAYNRFGRADTRPQENFKTYLIGKRKVNLGIETRSQNNSAAISGFELVAKKLPRTPSDFQYNPTYFQWVDDDSSFERMLRDIERCEEFTLDLESNNDHSYYGMICLMQLGTYETTYLLDPFPTFDNIQERLRPILESTRIIKVMAGCSNDVLALNRDMGINLAGVIDVQHVQMSFFEVMLTYIDQGKEDRIRDKDVHGYLWKAVTSSGGKLLKREDIERATKEGMSMTNMASIYLPKVRHPRDSTMADWRLRPIPDEMAEYATFDVHALLHIWGEMKKLIIAQSYPDWILETSINGTKKLLQAYFKPPKEESLQKAIAAARPPLTPINRERFEVLFRWRRIYGKVSDESENELLTLAEMNSLIKNQAETEEAVIAEISRRRIPCESVNTWAKHVGRLVQQGEEYWNLMERTKCHVCLGEETYVHAAWGCVRPYTRESKKAYYNQPENAQHKAAQHDRLRKKWYAKRGPNGPVYPGDLPR